MNGVWIALTVVLIFGNAFFVIAEYSLVRSRRASLQTMVDQGLRGSRVALSMLDEVGEYISTCQVGITFTSLGIGALGEPAFAELLEPVFGKLSHAAAVVISAIIAYLIITSAHIVIGELVPKLYAIPHAEGVLRRVARPLRFFHLLFRPFATVLTAAAEWILRRLGENPDKISEESGTPEELKALIAQSYTGGTLDPGEASMLTGVFHLHEQEARQVMTPVPAVIMVDVSEDVETALRRCVSSGHTRLVVTEDENRDRVRGIVHANSLAQVLMSRGPQASFDAAVRDTPIIPETKPLDDLLADLQRQHVEMAVVVDEYGRTAGIVTIEDIIEEIVGEIDDETDPAGGAVRRLANGDWFVRGHVAVTDLADYGLSLQVDTDAYNSVGGFVFAHLGRLPKRGDTVTANGYSIRVESVRENRIEAVRIRERRPPGAGAREED